MTDKQRLRKELLACREGVRGRAELSEKICGFLENWEPYKKAKAVLLYLWTGSEPQLDTLIGSGDKSGKRFFAPVCDLTEKGSMTFFQVKDSSSVLPGKYGIREPERNIPFDDAKENAICLVPGIAFDKEGFRLGYGGGYYDRFLESHNVFTAGICFQELLVDHLPHEPFDKRVNAVVTEEGIWTECIRQERK